VVVGVGDGGAYLVDVGAVDADDLVEGGAGDAELVGPVGDVGRHVGVDLGGIVRGEVRLDMLGVGLAELGLLDFLVLVGAGGIGMRHGGSLCRGLYAALYVEVK